MKQYKIKTESEYYQNIVSGAKDYLVFRDIGKYRIGDILILKEHDGKDYTDWETEMEIVGFIGGESGIPDGCVGLKLENCLETPFASTIKQRA